MNIGGAAIDVRGALDRARAFLAGLARDDDGLWLDFQLAPGASTDWVSGYVAAAIAGVRGDDPAAARAIAALVRRARRTGGWGYNKQVRTDADSTAWGLLALAHGRCVPPLTIDKALAALARHQSASGGVATYLDNAYSGGFRADWFAPQPCVTAAAILALLAHGESARAPAIDRAADFLVGARAADGTWASCWWTTAHYPSVHSLLALSQLGRLDARDRATTARALFAATPTGAGAFATALALRALLLCDPDPDVDAAIARAARDLCAAQLADGSFAAPPILRIPDETELGVAAAFADERRAFTTATALAALAVLARIPYIAAAGLPISKTSESLR